MRDETSLLERAREYDQAALSEIYDLYSRKIHSYIYRHLGDVHLAEDLTAEVFMKMLEAAQSKKFARTSLSAWLYRIAHNLIVDYFRSQSQGEVEPLGERLRAAIDDPTVVVEAKLAQQRLRAALSHLTQEQQQVIVLRFGEGLSASRVAEVLGKSEGAIRAQQHRALATMRRTMEGKRHEPGFQSHS
ncbi:MAG: sigma-70 family RNA polymerase sigma factor [Chloroflexi bacterium]|nr:sigma-70 family RNA polymerase sigma factor [Chloroflexota bacterium]